MEDMPEAFINYNGETLRATPENSRLITFLGREALNCILVDEKWSPCTNTPDNNRKTKYRAINKSRQV